jgi:predicted AAA+ superfamily ATPase
MTIPASSDFSALLPLLNRIAESLERMAPPPPPAPDFAGADGFLWHAPAMPGGHGVLQPVAKISRIPISLLKGIDHIRDILVENTQRFAEGHSANNVLLWGARGMGKSSLVKSAHKAVGRGLKLIELHREDIESLPALMNLLRGAPFRFILFCDDLSFDAGENAYKSLKAVLDGGIEGRPENVLFYATSNRRHLLPRDMMENEKSTAINPHEAVEEKVSLSDRFGLWLGVHKCSQDEYLAMIDAYAAHFGLDHPVEQLHHEALEWSTTRGSRAGRVAWQYINDLAGRLGKTLEG